MDLNRDLQQDRILDPDRRLGPSPGNRTAFVSPEAPASSPMRILSMLGTISVRSVHDHETQTEANRQQRPGIRPRIGYASPAGCGGWWRICAVSSSCGPCRRLVVVVVVVASPLFMKFGCVNEPGDSACRCGGGNPNQVGTNILFRDREMSLLGLGEYGASDSDSTPAGQQQQSPAIATEGVDSAAAGDNPELDLKKSLSIVG